MSALRGMFESWSMMGKSAAEVAQLARLPLTTVATYASRWRTPLTGRPMGLTVDLPADVADVLVKAARVRRTIPSELAVTVLSTVARDDLFAAVIGDRQ